jgi:hypothetical protein
MRRVTWPWLGTTWGGRTCAAPTTSSFQTKPTKTMGRLRQFLCELETFSIGEPQRPRSGGLLASEGLILRLGGFRQISGQSILGQRGEVGAGPLAGYLRSLRRRRR